jgi:hypothetical protein
MDAGARAFSPSTGIPHQPMTSREAARWFLHDRPPFRVIRRLNRQVVPEKPKPPRNHGGPRGFSAPRGTASAIFVQCSVLLAPSRIAATASEDLRASRDIRCARGSPGCEETPVARWAPRGPKRETRAWAPRNGPASASRKTAWVPCDDCGGSFRATPRVRQNRPRTGADEWMRRRQHRSPHGASRQRSSTPRRVRRSGCRKCRRARLSSPRALSGDARGD